MFNLWFFLAIGAVALFTFIAVATWTDNRTKERVTYYKQETYKKLIGSQGEGSSDILKVMRQDQRYQQMKTIGGIKLGGLITTFVGITLAVFLGVMDTWKTGLVGLIPFGVGVAMLIYAATMVPDVDDFTEPPTA